MRRDNSATARPLKALFCAAILAGCGDTETEEPTPAGGPAVDVASQSGDFKSPRDSALTTDAKTIYFVADSSKGRGLFRVSGDGGAVTAVATAGVLTSPVGVAISSDNKSAYVADTAAGAGGEILVVNLADGAVGVLGGTEGTGASAVTVSSGGQGDTIYYTGVTLSTMEPAVFSVPAGGGSMPTVIASGAPLVRPSGIAVAKDGTIYVADNEATDADTGKVFRISSGAVEPLVDAVITGDPAGVALTLDDSTLLVSSLDPATAHDQVVLVDVSTKKTSIFNAVIGANTAGGGVHRAADANVFAWADLSAGSAGSGLVYKITLK